MPKHNHPDLLSQEIPFADAAIYRLNENQAMVQSVDFFTPVVDDPYKYGQIAASNSLSDVFAVGAKPLTAMNVIGFPLCQLGPDVLLQILQGGAERVQQAGALIVGGHSVEDDEPKYGLSVTGMVDPNKMFSPCNCRVGDRLVLTKPLGTGIIATALKGEVLTEDEVQEAVEGMIMLNNTAAQVMTELGVTACTDITGFGLVGHGLELAEASNVGLQIYPSQLPAYPQAREMAEIGLLPEGAYRNRDYYFERVDGARECNQFALDLLSDPQTSGGLLIAVSKDKLGLLLQRLQAEQVPAFTIGEVVAEHCGRILLAD
ncbi:selenophosphate synthase [Malonomonas rubra DSM 5091]|uniref:Selenophosphate synthase n=1 Tax=Malonomonas rubra DSM 5091 TaxID=1122189 RepID=A0A1M6C1L5_MALRU|nr:selenophosphate synthase [Malonomonas rubra DSM 5091]